MGRLAKLIRANQDKTIILSSEELGGVVTRDRNSRNLDGLVDYLKDLSDDVRLIAYVREPASYYLSLAQERLKNWPGIVSPEHYQTRFSSGLQKLERAFGTTAIVKNFDRAALVDGDITSDFFASFGDLRTPDLTKWKTRAANASCTAEMMLVLDRTQQVPSEHRDSVASEEPGAKHLFRSVRRIARNLGNTAPPVLFREAAEMVRATSKSDCDELSAKYGIQFGDYHSLDAAPIHPRSAWVSDVEGIVPVDRELAFTIWSIVALKGARHMLQREKKKSKKGSDTARRRRKRALKR